MSCNGANVEFAHWLRAAPHYALTKETLLPWLVFMTLFLTWATRPLLPKPASWVLPNPAAIAQHDTQETPRNPLCPSPQGRYACSLNIRAERYR